MPDPIRTGGPRPLVLPTTTSTTPLSTPLPPPPPSGTGIDAFTRTDGVDPVRNAAREATVNRALERLFDNISTSMGLNPAHVRVNPDLLVNRPMTPEAEEKLQGALKDFLMDMPLSALSPALADQIRSLLPSLPADSVDKPLKDLGGDVGNVASRAAKEWLKNLWHDEPAALVALGVAGAVAAGTIAVKGGTDALKKLGIPTGFKFPIVGDTLKGRLDASFGPSLRDPSLTGGLSSTFRLGNNTTVNVDGHVTVGGSSFSDLHATGAGGSVNVTHGNLGANVNVHHDFGTGSTSVNGGLNLRLDPHTTMNLSGGMVDGRASTLGVGVSHGSPNLNLSAGVSHNFNTDVTSANLSLNGRRGNTEFYLSGGVDSRGDTNVSAGIRIPF
ncbi:MAG: hypothetical protein AB2A00_31000 [Myxococcota bacterium]